MSILNFTKTEINNADLVSLARVKLTERICGESLSVDCDHAAAPANPVHTQGGHPGGAKHQACKWRKRVERCKTKTINMYQSLRYLDIVMPELLWGCAWRRPSSSSCLSGYLLISSAALPDRDQGTSVVLRSTPESEWVSGPLTNYLYPRIIHLRSDSLF